MLQEVGKTTVEFIPPAIKELVIDNRGDWNLIMNPEGPSWCLGGKEVAIFVELCDGLRNLTDIFEIMKPYFHGLTPQDVQTISTSLSEDGLFSKGQRLPIRPLSNVTFNLTKICNLQCPFCYYDSGPNAGKPAQGELTTEEWIKLAGEFFKINSFVNIYVAGGEPIARKDCIDILSGIAKTGVERVTLITNGTLVDKKKAKLLAKIPNLRVQVSLDGIEEKINAVTRGAGSLEKTKNAIRWLLEEGCEVVISSTLTKINKDHVTELQNYCQELEIRLRTSLFFVGGDRSQNNRNEFEINPAELWKMVTDKRKEKENETTFSNPWQQETKQHLKPMQPRYSCGVGYGTVSVGPDGTINPCNHLTDSDMVLGNVRHEPMEDILKRGFERFNFVDVDQMPHEGCGGCPVRYICAGGCKASSKHAYGTMKTPPPDCSFLRQSYAETIWMEILGSEYSTFLPPSSYDWEKGPRVLGQKRQKGGLNN